MTSLQGQIARLTKPTKGQPITAAFGAAMYDAARIVSTLQADGTVASAAGGGVAIARGLAEVAPFLAKIGDWDSDAGAYEITEVVWRDDESDFVPASDGVESPEDGFALTRDGKMGHYCTDDVVVVVRGFDHLGAKVFYIASDPPKIEADARITGNATDGTNRWTYSATEIDFSSMGEDEDLMGGLSWDSGGSGSPMLFNLNERRNDSMTNEKGNQVDPSSPPSGCTVALKAIVTGTPVRVFRRRNTSGDAVWFFCEQNGLTIT